MGWIIKFTKENYTVMLKNPNFSVKSIHGKIKHTESLQKNH